VLCFVALLLASCRAEPAEERFPKPQRPVASIVADSFSTEDARDRIDEFDRVVELAGVEPGMWVADVGAGEGYYSVRLVSRRRSARASACRRHRADVRDRLAQRVQRENLDNVAVLLGEPDDPSFRPTRSTGCSWSTCTTRSARPMPSCGVREALKPEGLIVVVEADRPPQRHGMPPELLRCEFAAVGLQLRRFQPISGEAYFASFAAVGERPRPGEIEPCKA
jgi:hypothetical protein